MNYPKGALSWILVIIHPLLATCFQLMLLLTHLPRIISTISSTYSVTPLKHYKASLLQYFIGTLITLCYSIPLCVMYFSLTVGTCCSHCTYCFSYFVNECVLLSQYPSLCMSPTPLLSPGNCSMTFPGENLQYGAYYQTHLWSFPLISFTDISFPHIPPYSFEWHTISSLALADFHSHHGYSLICPQSLAPA